MGSAPPLPHSPWLFSPSVRGLRVACCDSRSCPDHFLDARAERLSHTDSHGFLTSSLESESAAALTDRATPILQILRDLIAALRNHTCFMLRNGEYRSFPQGSCLRGCLNMCFDVLFELIIEVRSYTLLLHE
ncbi:Uncharacterized protein DAT39_014560 [Clarias magur]|uniref:Uncharacterized protein n=1 Tax=Clarias magur TaxID=1594786 RepID=A0A8J4TTG6_CLAMG|nr:Uncharacterized protein DAT39_014560 [Clarias magur]